MPKHSRRPKSNKTLQAPKYKDLQTVQACWNAIEGFVNFGAIALGMLQLIALQFPNQIWNRFEGFLRTISREIPSERTTKTVIAHLLLRDFCKVSPSATMREIHANILIYCKITLGLQMVDGSLNLVNIYVAHLMIKPQRHKETSNKIFVS